MKNLKTNIIFWLAVSFSTFYWGVFWLVGYAPTVYIISALVFGFSLIVFITWFRTGLRAFTQGGREGEAILAFVICLIAVYSVYVRLWSVLRVYLQNPDWMNTSPFGLGASVLLLIFFSGVLIAPETKGGNVPQKNYLLWGLGILVAGFFIGLTIGIALSQGDLPAVPKDTVAPMSAIPSTCGDDKPVFVKAYCRALPMMRLTNAH